MSGNSARRRRGCAHPPVGVLSENSADGKQHIAVTVDNDTAATVYDGVWILLGNGAGGFVAAPGSPVVGGEGRGNIAAGDFHGDAKLDVAAPHYFSNNVSILLNTWLDLEYRVSHQRPRSTS